MEETLRIQAFFTALPLGFGVLHLFLFAALPRLRSNLYYGLFLLLIAATIFLDFQLEMMDATAGGVVYLRFHRAALAISFVFALRFFYEAFLGRAPAQFRYLAAGLVSAGALAVAVPGTLDRPLEILLVACLAESVRAMVGAIRRKQRDAWLIAGGFLIFLLFAAYDLLLDFGVMAPFRGINNAYQFGLVGLFVATSAFLARNVARTNRQLIEQERLVREREVERRVLETEVERTKAELEEARELQVSLLPLKLPERADLRFGVHMSTAAEVGGDYYDFRQEEDGRLVIAIGDATGHGLRAGIMVAVTKSLFQGLGPDEELTDFFQRCTRVLKPMRLGNLFMALTLVRVCGEKLTVSAAGMPPFLLYRSETGELQELILKGMPLGAFPDFRYQQICFDIRPEDVLVLMTDGLPELFNGEREMLGIERLKTAFREVVTRPADAIAAHLAAVGEAWRADSAQEDDVTLLVIKCA